MNRVVKKGSIAALPSIAVEEQTVNLQLTASAELMSELNLYAHYFAEATKRRPLSQQHVIVGILRSFLDNDHEFRRWKARSAGQFDPAQSPYSQQAL